MVRSHSKLEYPIYPHSHLRLLPLQLGRLASVNSNPSLIGQVPWRVAADWFHAGTDSINKICDRTVERMAFPVVDMIESKLARVIKKSTALSWSTRDRQEDFAMMTLPVKGSLKRQQ